MTKISERKCTENAARVVIVTDARVRFAGTIIFFPPHSFPAA